MRQKKRQPRGLVAQHRKDQHPLRRDLRGPAGRQLQLAARPQGPPQQPPAASTGIR